MATNDSRSDKIPSRRSRADQYSTKPFYYFVNGLPLDLHLRGDSLAIRTATPKMFHVKMGRWNRATKIRGLAKWDFLLYITGSVIVLTANTFQGFFVLLAEYGVPVGSRRGRAALLMHYKPLQPNILYSA